MAGKRAKLEELAKAISGPRRKEFAESEKRCKIDKETWFLHSTPQEEVLIIYLEAKDPANASKAWVASNHPFDLWVKEQAKECTRLDFSNPPPGEYPKQIVRYGY